MYCNAVSITSNYNPSMRIFGRNYNARTIRNRIQQLEEHGIITGYHASVDFERTGARLTNLFVCTAPVPERERLARTVLGIPGVIDVRELMSGRENLHITAVGTDTNDITRITRALAALNLEIEEEDLVQREHTQPYGPFGPGSVELGESVADFISLTGGAEVVELAVGESAPPPRGSDGARNRRRGDTRPRYAGRRNRTRRESYYPKGEYGNSVRRCGDCLFTRADRR